MEDFQQPMITAMAAGRGLGRSLPALAIKRAADLMVAIVGLILVSPLLAAVALLVYMREGKPIIYRAERVGRYGTIFHLYKFRTMVPTTGSSVTVWADPRVTSIGHFLRKTKLDELPQLVNVVKGEMSIVGFRPEDPSYVALYTPEQRKVLAFKPGITSAAALEYWDEEALLKGDDWEQAYRERIMPAKLAIDLTYGREWSLRKDLVIFSRTLGQLVRKLLVSAKVHARGRV